MAAGAASTGHPDVQETTIRESLGRHIFGVFP
jgi:hypothetical protein